jgi:hypothetical protein
MNPERDRRGYRIPASGLRICFLCSHLHDWRDELLEVPGVCMWCADQQPCPPGSFQRWELGEQLDAERRAAGVEDPADAGTVGP